MGHISARAAARLCAVTIALSMASGPAVAPQEAGAGTGASPEVPFVSQLRAEVSNGEVLLTWKDSPDVAGTCLVYRSGSEITAGTIGAAALVGEVKSGIQSWSETPPDNGSYYYAIVMQDVAGTRYPLLVPYRNVTTTAVTVSAAQPVTSATAPVTTAPVTAAPPPLPGTTSSTSRQAPTLKPAPASSAEAPKAPTASVVPTASAPATATASPPAPTGPDIPARITGIASTLSPGGDSVSITFASSSSSRDLLLFWSNAPLTDPADLAAAGAAAPLDPGTTRYVLPVLPGTTWWFAVLDAGLYKVGQFPLVPGLNVTSTPVRVPGISPLQAAAPVITRRDLPLPSLSVGGAQAGASAAESGVPPLPPFRQVSPTTARAIELLLEQARTPAPTRSPRILDADATVPEGGEMAQLVEIVQGPFQRGDMQGAEQALTGFLGVPRSTSVAAHARFYLGQSYWFQGRIHDALLEFLAAVDSYPAESQPWIDASLERLGAGDR